jgi:DNA-binding transcriptional MerR regulator
MFAARGRLRFMNASFAPHRAITAIRVLVEHPSESNEGNRGGPMGTWTDTATQLERRLETLERRMEDLAEHVKTLAQRTAELDRLRTEVGKLKFEVEDIGEG